MKQALSLEFALARKFVPWLLFMVFAALTVVVVACGVTDVALPMLAGMVPALYAISACSYDGVPGWDRYRASLPLARTEIVSARYAATLLFSLAVLAVIGVAAILIECLLGNWDGVDFASAVAYGVVAPIVLGMAFSLLVVAFMFPCVFRFGYTLGLRVAMAVVVFFAIGALSALIQLGNGGAEALAVLLDESGTLLFIPLFVALGTLALYFASMLLSVRLYNRREL